MKSWILTAALAVCCAFEVAGQGYQYFYEGESMPLSLNTQHAYLVLEPGQDIGSLRGMLMQGAEVKRWGTQSSSLVGLNTDLEGMDKIVKGRNWAQVQFPVAQTERQYLEMLNQLEESPAVALASPFFSDAQTGIIGLSEFFVVRVSNPKEIKIMHELAKATGTYVVGRNQFMANWYTLACDEKSKGNALEMANHFLKLGGFSASQPDLMTDDAPNCVNDALFADQWALQNTGQNGGTAGIDINACDAWANWTTGDPSVIIAILDQGYEENHPDLINNHSGLSWDSELGTSPAQITGSHGTACAGIAAAQGNNTIGVAGVARTCELMNIGNSLAGTPNSRQRRANGINWAWQNGAAVISNSWSSSVAYAVIDNAIDSAYLFGRGGLGTLVCFSSGNNNGAVSYPANSNPDILCVGAMSPCGERKNPASCDGENWGSNFGTTLDIVAPGVLIPTTDRQGAAGYAAGDYTMTFNGTSSACPHVAGLVGLIISMNPCLTYQQVINIIERSAQKVGGYAYATTAGRPNGTWDDEMGYGLIDADAALRMTRELYIQNVTITSDQIFQVFGRIAAGSNVTPTIPAGPVVIAAGADVQMRASVSITLAAGFSTAVGSTLQAYIITSANCSQWDLNAARMAPSVATMEPEAVEAAETQAAIAKISDWDLAVFPNPSKDAAKVAFRIPVESNVKVEVYDAGMNLITQVVTPKAFAAGVHEVDLDAQNIPAGIYFLRMSTDNQQVVRKLAIMH